MKTLIASLAALLVSAACTSTASAQQWDPWSSRDGRAYGDGGRYSSPGARYYDDDAYGPRVYRRFDQDDERRYDPRYNGGQDGRADRPDSYDDSYDDRADRNVPRYREDYGAWDAAPAPDQERQLSKVPGTSGGDRPYIRAVSPPVVPFSGRYAQGSIVIDTSQRKLYYVLSSTSAYAYSIGVGRQGFGWTGKEKISRIAEWPDWYPPAEMRKRQPNLPSRMLGGIRNPLGAKAIYLGNTLYRIHGTNDPKSIGRAESSGCFRMLNENVLHLASLVRVGTEVSVVRSIDGRVASAKSAKTPKTNSSDRRRSRYFEGRGDDFDDPYEYEPWR